MSDPTQNRGAILQALGEPFPRSAVKQKPGGGGKRLDYVEGHTVIRRLNATAPGWDWIIRGMDWRADMLVVWGDLTIPGLGTRSGIGISENMKGDVVKGASTDALKKAATLFGVALELYGPDYEAEPPPRQPMRAQVNNIEEYAEEEDGPSRITATEAQRLKEMCDIREMNGDERTTLLTRTFGVGKIGLLDEAQGATLSSMLNLLTDTELLALVEGKVTA